MECPGRLRRGILCLGSVLMFFQETVQAAQIEQAQYQLAGKQAPQITLYAEEGNRKEDET